MRIKARSKPVASTENYARSNPSTNIADSRSQAASIVCRWSARPAWRRFTRSAGKLQARWAGDLEEAAVGGGSDGNFTAGMGIPTLDGMGGVGEGAHAVHEYIVISELPRVARCSRREMIEKVFEEMSPDHSLLWVTRNQEIIHFVALHKVILLEQSSNPPAPPHGERHRATHTVIFAISIAVNDSDPWRQDEAMAADSAIVHTGSATS